jgi:hypothetical protein
MTFKPISRYRVAYFESGPKAGKTDIVVVFDDKESYTFEALPSATAHHLVDLLRNEAPIWVDPVNGTLVVADEPVGAGET